MEKQRKDRKAKSRVVTNVLYSIMFGLAMSAAVTHVLLPEAIAKEKFGHILQNLPGDRPYLHIIFPLLAVVLGLLNYVLTIPKKQTENSTTPSPSVGDGGRQIELDEMKLGGSGSCSVMNGEVVAKEVIRTKYVVNAAGNYSDKIANMIGDNSFAIQPRIGNYLLLHRNQVRLLLLLY